MYVCIRLYIPIFDCTRHARFIASIISRNLYDVISNVCVLLVLRQCDLTEDFSLENYTGHK